MMREIVTLYTKTGTTLYVDWLTRLLDRPEVSDQLGVSRAAFTGTHRMDSPNVCVSRNDETRPGD